MLIQDYFDCCVSDKTSVTSAAAAFVVKVEFQNRSLINWFSEVLLACLCREQTYFIFSVLAIKPQSSSNNKL